ncbi:MAG: replication initiator protein [Microviridae sp.]|nr:MAG: replication initiator protein [Microviridae sp.]
MPCYKPLVAWYSKEFNPSGKRGIVFNPGRAEQPDDPIDLPCGQCIGCRLERSRQWAVRCIHEAQLHDENCFITLTFSPEHLEKRKQPDSLDKSEFQRFMKRLRKHFGQQKIRFFHCGEYGEKYGRPHYHAILFGLDFADKQLHRVLNGHRLYTSRTLEKIWPYGYSSIGNVTFESAAYVARYILKKVTGDAADTHYANIDSQTGEIINYKTPEYTTMSRRPGIAAGWFDKYADDVYPSDFVTVRGKKVRPPKFYDRLMETTRPYEMEDIKNARTEAAKQHAENNTLERLRTREKVQYIKLKSLPRNLDKES